MLSKLYDDYCDLDELNRAVDFCIKRTGVKYHPQLKKMARKVTSIFIETRKLKKQLTRLQNQIPTIA